MYNVDEGGTPGHTGHEAQRWQVQEIPGSVVPDKEITEDAPVLGPKILHILQGEGSGGHVILQQFRQHRGPS